MGCNVLLAYVTIRRASYAMLVVTGKRTRVPVD